MTRKAGIQESRRRGELDITTEGKRSLLDAEGVEAWIEDNEPAGVEKLHSAVQQGTVKGRRARAFVLKYLWSRDDTPMSAQEARAEVRDKFRLQADCKHIREN